LYVFDACTQLQLLSGWTEGNLTFWFTGMSCLCQLSVIHKQIHKHEVKLIIIL